jgi:hypothetical protein
MIDFYIGGKTSTIHWTGKFGELIEQLSKCGIDETEALSHHFKLLVALQDRRRHMNSEKDSWVRATKR